jgi:hypothetical protein
MPEQIPCHCVSGSLQYTNEDNRGPGFSNSCIPGLPVGGGLLVSGYPDSSAMLRHVGQFWFESWGSQFIRGVPFQSVVAFPDHTVRSHNLCQRTSWQTNFLFYFGDLPFRTARFRHLCCTQVRARYKLGDLPTTSEAIAQPGTVLAQVY